MYKKRIRDLREDNDLSQKEIAEYLKIAQTVYSRYERGENEIPIKHIIKLCIYYNTTADYILGFTNKMEKLPKDGIYWK